jgi:two-component system sensor histidine kinase AtoS
VDLAELLEETARLVRKEAEWRNVEVRIDSREGIPTLEADVEAIRSSLLNLVLNSFEAMPDGGVLTLSLRLQGGEIVLEVADTGIGIPENEKELVFDFAYSTREGGTGLGLAMVHQYVVDDHGGTVNLESTGGEGTVVRLAFPLTPREKA